MLYRTTNTAELKNAFRQATKGDKIIAMEGSYSLAKEIYNDMRKRNKQFNIIDGIIVLGLLALGIMFFVLSKGKFTPVLIGGLIGLAVITIPLKKRAFSKIIYNVLDMKMDSKKNSVIGDYKDDMVIFTFT